MSDPRHVTGCRTNGGTVDPRHCPKCQAPADRRVTALLRRLDRLAGGR